jgi:hypothetical protein
MFRPTLALFRKVVSKVQWLIMLHKCSYSDRICMLSNKYIKIFKTWKWVTSLRKNRVDGRVVSLDVVSASRH